MRHLSVLALLPLLLLTACPGDDDNGSAKGTVSGTLTPYRSATLSSPDRLDPRLLSLVREVQRSRQAGPGVTLEQTGPDAASAPAQPAPLARAPRGTRAVPGELLVGFERRPQALSMSPTQLAQSVRTRVAQALPGLRVEHRSFLGRYAHRFALKRAADGRAPSEEETEAAAKRLRAQPGVRYVERNVRMYRMQTQTTPDDPYFPVEWHYALINLPFAWNTERNATDIVVAVVDSGLRPHPDLDPRRLPGFDFVSDPDSAQDGEPDLTTNPNWDDDPTDQASNVPGAESSHGTHVAGTVGAATNNALGVSGVTWNVKLLPVRALGVDGGDSADVAAGMAWAAGLDVPGAPPNPNPAKVINMSLGGIGDPLQTYQDIIDEAASNPGGGSIFVIAAGNENESATRTVPCNQQRVICVGAVGYSGARSSYSDFGEQVDIMAPGGEMREDLNADRRPDGVLSLIVNNDLEANYGFLQGTSMAAPHVTGVVALMAAARSSANPLTFTQAETILRETANPTSQCSEGCGAGLVNALGAVTRAAGAAPSGPPTLSTSTPELAFVQGGRATQAIHLVNVGGGTFTVRATAGGPEAARLRFPAGDSVTLGAGEAQSLRVGADFTGLTTGLALASVALDAGAAGSATVAVRLRAGTFEDRDAIVVFVTRDEQGNFVASEDTAALARAADGYTYRLDLDPATYFAIAGIDDNGNGEAFDDGERTGFWKNVDNLVEIPVAANEEVTGIDFDLVPFTTLSSAPTPAVRPLPLR